MAKRVVLWPYEIYSQGARALQDYLQSQGIRCIRVYSNGRYTPRKNDLIINWGNHNNADWHRREFGHEENNQLLNLPWVVDVARNKLRTFVELRNKVSIPEFTVDRALATEWQKKHSILCRSSLNGSRGTGITFFEAEVPLGGGRLPQVPLYVKYIKKKAEFRVHVFQGKVIDVQQKRKRKDFEGEVDSKIRNHDRGWVFCRDNVTAPDSVLTNSIGACASLGLDFGAVDVIWNDKQKQAYVLEVNTAPGLEGSTVESYGKAVVSLL